LHLAKINFLATRFLIVRMNYEQNDKFYFLELAESLLPNLNKQYSYQNNNNDYKLNLNNSFKILTFVN